MIAFVDPAAHETGSSGGSAAASYDVRRARNGNLMFTLRSSLNVPLLRSIAFQDEPAIRRALIALRAAPDEAFVVRKSSAGYLVVFLSETGEILARGSPVVSQALANANRTLVMLQARAARPRPARMQADRAQADRALAELALSEHAEAGPVPTDDDTAGGVVGSAETVIEATALEEPATQPMATRSVAEAESTAPLQPLEEAGRPPAENRP